MSLAPDDVRHGTANGYSNCGCRCKACRAAWATYFTERSHRLGYRIPRADYLADLRQEAWAQPCGTESKYGLGCRCTDCTDAQNEARNRRRWIATPAQHGKASSYKNGCRCDECREAHRVYHAAWRRQRKSEAA